MRKMLAVFLWVGMLSFVVSAQKISGSTLPLGNEQDKIAVQQVIKDYAQAFSDFPTTRELENIIKFHSKEFSGVDNGKTYGLNDIRESLKKILDSLKMGHSVSITTKVKNINVKFEENSALVSFESWATVKVNGKSVEEQHQKIKETLIKNGQNWLIAEAVISHVKEEAGYKPTSTRVLNQTFSVAAGQMVFFPVNLSKFGSVTGRFDVGGNRYSDIKAFLISAQDYDNFRNNRPVRLLYASGQVVSGSINMPAVSAGYYYLVFSNGHSLLVGASISAVVDVTEY